MSPCFLKKGAVNTPSEFHFFQKKNGGSDFNFKAAAILSRTLLSALNCLPYDGFFYMPSDRCFMICYVL